MKTSAEGTISSSATCFRSLSLLVDVLSVLELFETLASVEVSTERATISPNWMVYSQLRFVVLVEDELLCVVEELNKNS